MDNGCYHADDDHWVRTEPVGNIQGLRTEVKDEIWKVRMLVIVVLVVTVIRNSTVIEFAGKIFGIARSAAAFFWIIL